MKSRDYFGYTVFEDGVVLSKFTGKKMRPADNGRGYLILTLSIGKGRKVKAVHRIVAEAFIPNPNNLSDVDHIDGDRRNNHKSNLRWLTHGDNIRHSYKLKNRSAEGTKNANCKTKEVVVLHICELLQSGMGLAEIRDTFKYPYNTARDIKGRKRWLKISKNYSW